MVKHSQTIRWLLPTNCLSVCDKFVVLALKVLKNDFLQLLLNIPVKKGLPPVKCFVVKNAENLKKISLCFFPFPLHLSIKKAILYCLVRKRFTNHTCQTMAGNSTLIRW